MNYALCFPGQGAQSIGMGKEIYKSARDVFAEADDSLSFHLTKLIFEGDEAELTLTKNSQPAIMTVSIAALRALTNELGANINPVCCAGHSLGEYTALAASGVLEFHDAVRLVRDRGIFMQEAVPAGQGAMAALMGLDEDGVKNLCDSVAPDGEIAPAGVNELIDKAIESAKTFGAKRAVKLNVSAPFHSKFMKPAADKLKAEFEKISWNEAKYDIIANVSAKPVKNPDEIRKSLYAQTFSPVLWQQSVNFMIDELKVDTFIELGPGEVLTGLIKRIRKGINLYSSSKPEKLEDIAKCLL